MAAVQILGALQAQDEAALAAFDSKYWGVVRFTTERDQILRAMGLTVRLTNVFLNFG